MRMRMLSILAGAMLTGCIARGGLIVGERDPYWDGHAYVTFTEHVHCVGCGHYYYDSGWNLYPANHVYVQAGYARHSLYRGRPGHGHGHH